MRNTNKYDLRLYFVQEGKRNAYLRARVYDGTISFKRVREREKE
jgi:uncharacterized membrane-anchored protein